MSNEITDMMLDSLRVRVVPYYQERRYAHVLAVEREIMRLGGVFLPERINELRAAALLHDITKAYSFKKQLQCCKEFGIISSMRREFSPETLHAKTGAVIAQKDFADIANDDICSAIKWHTTGHKDMTVFDSLLYIADYIEETRQYEQCIRVREFLWSSVETAKDETEKLIALYQAMVMALDATIITLCSAGKYIEPDTVEARNHFLHLLGNKR